MSNVFATWTLDNGSYRGLVISSKTFNTTMRTEHIYPTPQQAQAAARELISKLESA